MPLASDPVAWVSATAASLAEMVSKAVKRSETRYRRPATRPATIGSVSAAALLASTIEPGLSSGISVIAVSTFIVLAGPNRPCGSFAASTCPVLALATTQAEAGTAGTLRAGRPTYWTTVPRLASSGPPTVTAAAAGFDPAAAGSGAAARQASATAAPGTTRRRARSLMETLHFAVRLARQLAIYRSVPRAGEQPTFSFAVLVSRAVTFPT